MSDDNKLVLEGQDKLYAFAKGSRITLSTIHEGSLEYRDILALHQQAVERLDDHHQTSFTQWCTQNKLALLSR